MIDNTLPLGADDGDDSGLEGRVSALESKVSKIESQIEDLYDKISLLEDRVYVLEDINGSKAGFVLVSNSLRNLQSDVSQLQSQMIKVMHEYN